MTAKTKQQNDCEESLKRLRQWFEQVHKPQPNKKIQDEPTPEWLKDLFNLGKEVKQCLTRLN